MKNSGAAHQQRDGHRHPQKEFAAHGVPSVLDLLTPSVPDSHFLSSFPAA
jgi:hypothetical protein